MFILRKKWGGHGGLLPCHGWLYIEPEDAINHGCRYLYIDRGNMRKPLLVLARSFEEGNRFEKLGEVCSQGRIEPLPDHSVHLIEDPNMNGPRINYQLAQDAVGGILLCACQINPNPEREHVE